MHELACVSGIAAAYRLGAEYVKPDGVTEDFFRKHLLLAHGVVFSQGGGESRGREVAFPRETYDEESQMVEEPANWSTAGSPEWKALAGFNCYHAPGCILL